MYKDNLAQFIYLSPLNCLKNCIREKLFGLAIAGKKLEKVDLSDFTQRDIDYLTGCLIALDDYKFEFIYESDSYFDLKKSVVNFMLDATNYIQADFLLITQVKTIAVNHFRSKLEDMIDDLKTDVQEDLIEHYRVTDAKE